MYSVYVLYSKKVDKLYTGFSEKLKERIIEHKNGRVQTTKDWLPLYFIYAELYSNKKDALKRERFFKSGWGKQYLQKILYNTLKDFKKFKNLGGGGR